MIFPLERHQMAAGIENRHGQRCQSEDVAPVEGGIDDALGVGQCQHGHGISLEAGRLQFRCRVFID